MLKDSTLQNHATRISTLFLCHDWPWVCSGEQPTKVRPPTPCFMGAGTGNACLNLVCKYIYIYIKCVLNPASVVTNVCHPNKTSPCSCKHFAQSCSALDCGGNGWWWDWWADHHPSSEDENLSNSVRVWSVYKTNQWQTPRIYMFIVIT